MPGEPECTAGWFGAKYGHTPQRPLRETLNAINLKLINLI
jgi:hypothetical protein